MSLSSLPQSLTTRLQTIKPIYLTAIPASIATLLVLRSILRSSDGARAEVIQSPLHSLTYDELDELPYAPDSLPGGRDVESPWGSVRVYEWGPVLGKKVLLVHGISTPCIALQRVAEGLVEKGCRVMVFDLFGRGFSDSVSNTPHDLKLYTTQILLCLASSPLSWTGSYTTTRHGKTTMHKNSFSMVGYSLGGALSMAFTSYFPELVDSLVLIAPAGLIRESHVSGRAKLMYGGWLPKSMVHSAARKRILSPPQPTKKPKAEDAVGAEIGADPDNDDDEEDKLKQTIAEAVKFQIDNHPGFIPAFVSSLQHCPIHLQETRPLWATIAARLGHEPEEYEPEPEPEPEPELEAEPEAEPGAEEDDDDDDEPTELPAIPEPERAFSPGRAPSVRSTRSSRSSRSGKSGSSSGKHSKSKSSKSGSSSISSWFGGSSEKSEKAEKKKSSSKTQKSSSSKRERSSSKTSSSRTSKHKHRSSSTTEAPVGAPEEKPAPSPEKRPEKVRAKAERKPEPVDVVKESLREEEPILKNGKILFILGRDDPIIIEDEIMEDAERELGEDNVEFFSIDAGHEVPITKSDEVVGAISEFWGLQPPPAPVRRHSRVTS